MIRVVAGSLLILLVVMAAGCRHPLHRGPAARPGIDPEALADSLEKADGWTGGAGTTDSEDRLAAEWENRMTPESSRPAPPGRPLISKYSAHSIHGARRDDRIRGRLLGRIEVGCRLNEVNRTGYVSAGRSGPLAVLTAGNLRAGFGEGLLLGRRDPAASPLAAGTRQGDLRVRPSISLYERTDGVGVMFRSGWTGEHDSPKQLAAGLLVWDRYEHSIKARQRECWLTVSLTFSQWWWGMAAGRLLPAGSRLETVAAAPRLAWSVALRKIREGGAGNAAGSRAGLSMELARLGPDLFFVFGGSGRGRGRWTGRFFRQPAPSGYGGSSAGLGPVAKIIQGGTGRLAGRLKTAGGAVHLYAARAKTSLETASYRRIHVNLSWRPPGRRHRLKAVIGHYQKDQTRAALSIPGLGFRGSRKRENRLGLQWEYDPNMFINNKLRVDLRFEGGRRVGAVLSQAVRLSCGDWEAAVSATNYTLEPGRSGYLVRPGVGSFEYLSLVYGDGSDVSLRVSWFPRPGLKLVGYCGRPWGKDPRLYLSACLRGD